MNHQQPTEPEIAAQAYRIYLQRGRLSGHAMDDWLQAEYELMRLPVRELAKSEQAKQSRGSVVEVVRRAMR